MQSKEVGYYLINKEGGGGFIQKPLAIPTKVLSEVGNAKRRGIKKRVVSFIQKSSFVEKINSVYFMLTTPEFFFLMT